MVFRIQLVQLDPCACESVKCLTYANQVEMCYEFFKNLLGDWEGQEGRYISPRKDKVSQSKETIDPIKEGLLQTQ